MDAGQAAEVDKDLNAIVVAMEQAKAAEDAGRPEGVTEAVQHVEQLLAREREPAEAA